MFSSARPRLTQHRRHLLVLVAGLLLAACGGGEDAGSGGQGVAADVAETVQSDWAKTPVEFRERVGERFGFVCPKGGTAHTVWGSEVYTDDSSVCTAGVHAGKITFDGGTVVIEMRAGEDAYTGSEANGVTTQDYAEWPGSFVIP